jgi:hypothetical protein
VEIHLGMMVVRILDLMGWIQNSTGDNCYLLQSIALDEYTAQNHRPNYALYLHSKKIKATYTVKNKKYIFSCCYCL